MRRLLENLAEHKRSLFLILDDINGLAGSDEFANWLKSTVDEIATSDTETRLSMLVVGLEARRQELVERQPSLARVLDPIDIAPWSDDEVLDFYHAAFREGNAEISEASVRMLALYTGGLPVLAHELGDAVWRTARSPRIDRSEVVDGIVAAAGVVGRKLLEPGIFRAITSERYRSIFRKMMDDPHQMRVSPSPASEPPDRTGKGCAGQLPASHEDAGRHRGGSRGPGRVSLPEPSLRPVLPHVDGWRE